MKDDSDAEGRLADDFPPVIDGTLGSCDNCSPCSWRTCGGFACQTEASRVLFVTDGAAWNWRRIHKLPKHPTYRGQADVRVALSQQVKSLTTLAAVSQSTIYHRHIGKVYSWKPGGFGFITEQGMAEDIYFHIRDVLDGSISAVPEGSFVEYDITEGKNTPRAVNIVLLN